jgi:pimeloyl-ACP methyl ester carboxylesterase
LCPTKILTFHFISYIHQTTNKKTNNHFDAHVIAFDYRGFGDNEGAPTEDGTRLDARACSKWLDNALKGNENVMKNLYGHSLGSSIGAFLLADKNFGAKYDGFIMIRKYRFLLHE